MSDDVLYEAHGHVRLITLNRPEKMNSLDFEANDTLVERWKEFDADPEARVAVVTGAGDRAFCAGADLKTYTMAFAQTPAPEFQRRYTNGPGFGGITRTLNIFKPIVAAVNGYAVSGGLELALACDVRFCSPNAEFGLQDVRWGFHACDGGLIRLKEIVGLGNAMEMVLSGDLFDAEHAYRIGLVNRVVAQERLLEHTIACAEKLASRAPLAQRLAKEVVRRVHGLSMDEALRLESMSFRNLAHTEDLAEGNAAFRERRPAPVQGALGCLVPARVEHPHLLRRVDRAHDVEPVVGLDVEELEDVVHRPLGIEVLARVGVEGEEVILGPGVDGGVRFEPYRHAGDAGLLVLPLRQVLFHRVDGVRLNSLGLQRLHEAAQLAAREREAGHERRIDQGHVERHRKTLEQVMNRGGLVDSARRRGLDVEEEVSADETLGAGDILNRADDFDAHVRLRAESSPASAEKVRKAT